jgi:hypothetical protein
VLLEQPLDKILTMILFAVVKKGAATVQSKEPLKLEITSPLPEGLYPYEAGLLQAFARPTPAEQRPLLQDMMVELVKSVSQKMKGFSRRETIAYYQDVMRRAWAEVEAAGTPEVKSQKYNEVMEWTMLDKNYGDRTEDVFRNTPIFIPTWWGHYDPGYGRSVIKPSAAPISAGSGTPSVPGADFAASLATGVQTFSSKVVGNINDFTSKITSITNPPPKPSPSTYRGGGGAGGHGCACACACACAGCACACAGGGR